MNLDGAARNLDTLARELRLRPRQRAFVEHLKRVCPGGKPGRRACVLAVEAGAHGQGVMTDGCAVERPAHAQQQAGAMLTAGARVTAAVGGRAQQAGARDGARVVTAAAVEGRRLDGPARGHARRPE